MGNKCSNTDGAKFNLAKEYHKEDLPLPWSSDFTCNQEKDIFMAVNYFRKYPKKLVPFVRQCKTTWPEQFKEEKKINDSLCKMLAQHETLKPVKFDTNANKACAEVNKKLVAAENDEPVSGGLVDCYNAVVGSNETPSNEFSVFGYKESPEMLIAYQLLDYQVQKEKGQKDKTPDDEKLSKDLPHPILSKELSAIGVSYKSHKKAENLTQVLYVLGAKDEQEQTANEIS